MNNNNNGLLVILSGPSGSGKDTILTELTKRDMNIKVSTSMTTRKKREWEVDGIHYYFVDKDYFMRKIDEGQVLEYAQYVSSRIDRKKNNVTIIGRNERTLPTPAKIPSMIRLCITGLIP